jgi:hypothetical protein
MTHEVRFRFPAIRPLVPPPSAWLPYLDSSYAQHWFSTFGPVATQFERELTARFADRAVDSLRTTALRGGQDRQRIGQGFRGDAGFDWLSVSIFSPGTIPRLIVKGGVVNLQQKILTARLRS